jgi:hypothetical protein
MKGLVTCALVLGSFVSLGHAPAAGADPTRRVIVTPFGGTGVPRFREQTITALSKLGQQVVPDRNLSAAVTRLRLKQPSDNYQSLARELNATLFIEGFVTAKKSGPVSAQITAKNNRGEQVGRAIWTAANLAALQTRVQQGLFVRVESILSAEPAVRARAQPGDALTRLSRRARPGSAGSTASLSAMADPEEEGERRSSTIDFYLGSQFYTRRFAYNQNVSGQQQGHRSAGVPAPNLLVDYFFMPSFGVSLGAEYSSPLVSQDRDGNRHRTSSLGYSLGGKARFDIGGDLTVGAAYGENRFSVSRDDSEPNPPQMADLSYRQLMLGSSIRFDLFGSRVAVIGGGNYLHLLGLGQLESAAYFPRITGRGGEGYAGAAIPVNPGFEVRVMANLRRYVFAMNNVQTDPRVAGGAVDQFLGVNLGVAYRD